MWNRYIILAAMLAAAAARAEVSTEPRATTEDKVGAIATRPLTDTNIKKPKIPPLLQSIAAYPYDLKGLNSCPRITAAIRQLDAVLGPDFDMPSGDAKRDRAANLGFSLASDMVGGLIPFNGVVRELTGANDELAKKRSAYLAGAVRRAFLKGYGKSRKCAPPAAPLPAAAAKAESR